MYFTYFTEEQYASMTMTKEQAEKIANQYLSNNMKELKSIVNQLIKKKKMPKYFNEDLMEIGEDVFIQSIYTYSPESKASFKTFLWGNIWRKFWTYRRDITKSCRCVLEPEIDEETKDYKRDKNGKIIMRPLFDISMYSTAEKEGNEKEIWEYFESEYNVEDIVMENEEPKEEYSNTINEFLENISRDARIVAEYILDGYSKDMIIKCKGVTTEQYNDAIREFGTLKNVHILLGGKCNAKN